MRGLFEFRLQQLQNALDIIQNIIVPNPDCPIPEPAHHRSALAIGDAVCMLAAIDLDNEAQIATHEIREIGSDRLPTHEFESGRPLSDVAFSVDICSNPFPSSGQIDVPLLDLPIHSDDCLSYYTFRNESVAPLSSSFVSHSALV